MEKEIKAILSQFLSPLKKEISQVVSNRFIEYQAEEYNRNLYGKTLLFRTQPKELYDYYIPLHLKPFDEITFFDKRISTDSTKQLFKIGQYITIIGNAGSGKSTLIKHLILDTIDQGTFIPIKVELRYLNSYKGDLHDYLKHEIFKLNKIAEEENIIERLLLSGKFSIFLDGYDEINNSIKPNISSEINNLVKVYNKNRFIITSRPYTGIEMFPLFKNFEVRNLSKGDIKKFVYKQLPPEEEAIAEKILFEIKKPENKSFKGFLDNPLILTMFILTFQSYAKIPDRKSIFYQQVFDSLYSTHDSLSKLAFVREKTSGLSKEQMENVISLFSFLSFFEDKFIFSPNYFQTKFEVIKSKKKDLDFEILALLHDLKVAIGFIIEEGLDLTFPHRSLQEYFAAKYISKLNNENKNKIYTKLTRSIKFENKEHFYELLHELDSEDFLSQLVIPYISINSNEIRLTKEDLVSDSFERLKISYIFRVKKILFFLKNIFRKDDQFTRLYNDILEIENSIPDRKVFMEKKEEEAKKKFDHLKELLSTELRLFEDRFKKHLGNKVDIIKAEIKESSQGDSDIIELM